MLWHHLHGDNHIDTALALDGVSLTYKALNKPKEFLNFSKRVLAIRENVLGHKHPDTAVSFSNVGIAYATLGDFAQALIFEERALAISKEIWGIRNLIEASVLGNLADIYDRLHDPRNAIEMAVKSFELRKDLLGDQHPETIVTMTKVAEFHCKLGRVLSGFQLFDEYILKIPQEHSMYKWLRDQNRAIRSRYFLRGFRQIPKKKR
jgi:tetratricopeptide (TPR) repeat protein